MLFLCALHAQFDVGISSLFTNYQSPLIHHALVSNLLANTTYYYTVGGSF